MGHYTNLLYTAVLASILLPIAITFWNSANQDGWTSTMKTLWAVAPLFMILGVVLAFIFVRKVGRD